MAEERCSDPFDLQIGKRVAVEQPVIDGAREAWFRDGPDDRAGLVQVGLGLPELGQSRGQRLS